MSDYRFDYATRTFKDNNIKMLPGYYSRYTGGMVYFAGRTQRELFPALFSNLSQVLHDVGQLSGEVTPRYLTFSVETFVSNVIVMTLRTAMTNEDYDSIVTSVPFGNLVNIFKFVVLGSPIDKEIEDYVNSKVPMYTRSTGERVPISEMHDGHLINALLKEINNDDDFPFTFNYVKQQANLKEIRGKVCFMLMDYEDLLSDTGKLLYNEMVERESNNDDDDDDDDDDWPDNDTIINLLWTGR
jgi:hypothetical protein